MTEPTPPAVPSPYAAPGAIPPYVAAAPATAQPAAAAPAAAPLGAALPATAPLAGPPVVRTTSTVLPVTVAIAAVAVVAAVVNQVFGAQFPGNAPVEQIYNFGITVDLVAVALAVVIRLLVVFRRPPGVAPGGLSAFAIAGASIAVVVLLGWLLFGGADYWTGGMQRYMSGAAGAFYLGVPWVLTLVFGEIAVRRGDSALNRGLAIGSLSVGTLVGITTVAAAVIYGLGLSA